MQWTNKIVKSNICHVTQENLYAEFGATEIRLFPDKACKKHRKLWFIAQNETET